MDFVNIMMFELHIRKPILIFTIKYFMNGIAEAQFQLYKFNDTVQNEHLSTACIVHHTKLSFVETFGNKTYTPSLYVMYLTQRILGTLDIGDMFMDFIF
jgi:hypothetical protein